ncbi:hypothetical protein H9X57_14075 [Flavobacterium piscinae]|uniref:hypothetical protein n=1 Tax=Flavobacterium piscinae TaxID=2506424 RepID=UPI0019BCE21D|nr:hypothetical protein [Flavobacterium piscinae]MBC8884053.1 hypothetical protein [Flavobacterium piscinae]
MDAPKEILKELYWSFYQVFSDKEKFEKELIEYNTRLLKPKPNWIESSILKIKS